MGTKTSIVAVVPAVSNTSSAVKAGRSPAGLLAAAQLKVDELVVDLREIVKDMSVGDPNIAAINALITNLS